jgi:hypothetical protein
VTYEAQPSKGELARVIHSQQALIRRAAELLRLGSSPAWQWLQGRNDWLDEVKRLGLQDRGPGE